METDGIEQRRRTAVAMALQMQHKNNEQEQQLLPGIPDEVTLKRISPKVPWKDLQILSAVSRGWRQSIQSRLVYDSRVRASSTETLVLHSRDHCKLGNPRLALYSVKDERCYELPPIPGVSNEVGIPLGCQCIALNGKVYVLGGFGGLDFPSKGKEVYVLDMAMAGQWKRCASMKSGRSDFACGAKDGKIYVFGGFFLGGCVSGSEVYNREKNSWSSILPMASLRDFHDVTSLGEKLFVHGGSCYMPRDAGLANQSEFSSFSEIYDPVNDAWTVVGPSHLYGPGALFEAQGKPHWMNGLGIHAYDNGSWKYVHSNSFPIHGMGPKFGPVTFSPVAVCGVDSELFVSAFCYSKSDRSLSGVCLLQSEGFGGKDRELFWQVVTKCYGRTVGCPLVNYVCTIHL
ncbi:unnamed protein product [Calypogeia fissa]